MAGQALHVAKVCSILVALAALLAPAAVAAGVPSAPLAPYVQAAPLPLNDSRLPEFVDDDEIVTAMVGSDGTTVKSMSDDLTLKLRGSGDFVIRMLGQALSAVNRGGETTPILDQGHVVFMGFLLGPKLVNASAGLDPQAHASDLRVRMTLGYRSRGHTLDPAHLPTTPTDVEETIAIDNLTTAPATFVRGDAAGRAGRDALGRTLEALRAVSRVYTPELDLQAAFPLPPDIPVVSATPISAPTYIPFHLLLTVRLGSDQQLLDPGGGAVDQGAGGKRLKWDARLPSDNLSPGQQKFTIRYRTSGRPAAVDLLATPSPFAEPVFTPAGGAAWSTALASQPTTADEVVLAQAGALALHRVGELVPPLGRPGPGPVLVQYHLIFEPPPAAASKAAPPPHAKPWAVALTLVLVGFAGANAWWAWSRH